jgi:hypothetical protein
MKCALHDLPLFSSELMHRKSENSQLGLLERWADEEDMRGSAWIIWAEKQNAALSGVAEWILRYDCVIRIEKMEVVHKVAENHRYLLLYLAI